MSDEKFKSNIDKNDYIEDTILFNQINSSVNNSIIFKENDSYQLNLKTISIIHKELQKLILSSNFNVFESRINKILAIQNEYCTQISDLSKTFIFNHLKDFVSLAGIFIFHFFLILES